MGSKGEQFVQTYTTRYGESPKDYSGFYYDCLYGMLLSYHKMLDTYTIDQIAARDYPPHTLDTFVTKDYQGVTGHIVFTETYERMHVYDVFNWNGATEKYQLVATSDENAQVTQSNTPAVFYDGSTTIPSDRPQLLPDFVEIGNGEAIAAIILYALTMGIVIASLGLVWVYRDTKRIKSVSALFCSFILVGLGMVLFTIIADVGRPEMWSCNAYVWWLVLGTTLILVSENKNLAFFSFLALINIFLLGQRSSKTLPPLPHLRQPPSPNPCFPRPTPPNPQRIPHPLPDPSPRHLDGNLTPQTRSCRGHGTRKIHRRMSIPK